MPFSRKKPDKDIDEMIVRARAAGMTGESLFLIDAPLREFVVAVEQMVYEKAELAEICDSTVLLVCSMINSLSRTAGIKNEQDFILFSNKFMYEVSVITSAAINAAEKNKNREYYVEELDPNRTEH
jgi:hypothetical protein